MLVYVGNIGTGFGADKVSRLMPALEAAASDKNPFGGKNAPRKKAGVHWLEPKLWPRSSLPVLPAQA
jgi:bifunctional non-homologous end joining protein LigD